MYVYASDLPGINPHIVGDLNVAWVDGGTMCLHLLVKNNLFWFSEI